MVRLCYLFLLLFLGEAAEAAQIYGRITDESGEALAFAAIVVEGATQGTTTNLEGYYALTLAPGRYTLVYQYLGYEPGGCPLKCWSKIRKSMFN